MFQIFLLDIMEIDLKTCSFCLNKLLSLLSPLLFLCSKEERISPEELAQSLMLGLDM